MLSFIRSLAFPLTLFSAVCYITMMVSTILGNQPINSRTLEVDPQNLTSDWHDLRTRWNRLHTLRVALTTLGLGALVMSSLEDS